MDTAAFVALADSADANHTSAQACLNEMVKRSFFAVVPLPVVFETYRYLLHILGRGRAWDFLVSVYEGSVNLVRLETEDEDRARELLRRYEDVDLTLTDAACMSVMERLGVGSVFTFDADFAIAGFLRVPPLPP
jgi:predicted nucleic acid-binding protein